MIKIISVTAKNFKSFMDLNFNIKDGLFLIEGDNRDDHLVDSNGAGKTTLFDSILWSLKGETLSGLKHDRVVNNIIGKNTSATILFSVDDVEYSVTRYRKHDQYTNQLKVSLGDQDISGHTIAASQEIIDSILRVPSSLLKSSILIDHTLSGRFTSVSPSQRVHLLETIRGEKVWDNALERVKSDVKDLETKIRQSTVEIEKLKSNRELFVDNLKRIKTSLLNLDSVDENQLLSLKEREVSLSLNLSRLLESVDLSKNTLKSHKESFLNLNSELDIVKENLSQVQLKLSECNHQIRDSASKSSRLDSEVNTLRKEIETSKSCGSCGRPFSPDSYTVFVSTCEEKISSLLEQLSSIKTNHVALQTELSDLSTKESELKHQLESLSSERSSLELKIQHIEQSIESEQADCSQLSTQISDTRIKLSECEGVIKSVEDNRKRLKSEAFQAIKSIDTVDDQVRGFNETLSVDNSKMSYLLFWLTEFSPRGSFRSRLFSDDLSFINSRVSHYVSRLFNRMTVELLLDGKDSIDIHVTNNGVESSIQMLSAGELRRVDLAIQFSIFDLIKSTSSVSTNILCIDEVFDGLDSIGVHNVISLLDEMSSEIPSIYVISHSQSVKSLIHDHIHVLKRDSVSTLEA